MLTLLATAAVLVACVILIANAFRGMRRTAGVVAPTLVVVASTFTSVGWAVHIASAILLFAVVEFAFRPLHKTWPRLIRSVGCLLSCWIAATATGWGSWAIWPLLAIGLLWYVTGGYSRARRGFAKQRARVAHSESPASDTTSTPGSDRPDLVTLMREPRLPREIGAQLRTLHQDANAALRLLHQRQAGTAAIFEVEQIRDDFAVEAVRSYLALPDSALGTPLHEGKTPQVLLHEQLTLLSSGIDAAVGRSTDNSRDDVLASHLFVRDRFGRSSEDLTL